MRALYLDRPSQPSELTVREMEKPALTEGQVIIRVHAAGVNPSDVLFASGSPPAVLLPRTPGRDFAGIVVEGPDNLVGKEVYGTGGDLGIHVNGTHAEYLSIPIGAAALKPESLSMAQAAAVGVPFVTACKGLVDLAQLKAGETILIVGGSGSVGSAAAQIAKWIGARVIATTRRGDEESVWRRFADVVVELPAQNLVETVKAETGGKGVQVVFNAVGGETFEAGLNSLAPHGRMVCISVAAGRQVSFDLLSFYRENLRLYGLNTIPLTAADCAKVLDHLKPGFETGALAIEVARELPLDQAAEAYALVKQGGVGKIVLTM